ncbi:LLM class flavin-dependent oxidoreductase [Dactylosporangium sp. McL0621]|uniref:LLM class flavin-dependent oxidoreductase n=1 Tax=Dactylosporangium sp. McL0621 TaxID=3415678 RepID=UPI003CF80030
MRMRHGICVCTLGDLAEPSLVVDIGRAAEKAGWESLFVWDHLAFAWGVPSADPWVTLAAVAQATSALRLGTAVTPLPRRRPAVVASAVATLDRLSRGRVVLGVGLGGVDAEFTAFGESAELKSRARLLDAGLETVGGLLGGASVGGVTLAPLPVQRPRPPILVGGASRAALRRAARWDGWIAAGDEESGRMAVRPESVAADIAYIRGHREPAFEVALTGTSRGPDDPMLAEYEQAGVTLWLEHIHGRRGPLEDLMRRIDDGPAEVGGQAK